jgi:flagellum-specific ATP synthase
MGVADAVRSILDGHIVMERQIAERSRYPAINILRSVSAPCRGRRPGLCPGPRHARQVMATYPDIKSSFGLERTRLEP